ncbi:retrovirus-related pol polyprotein from transposon TNT 1-94 [Tanacetum coccineum]
MHNNIMAAGSKDRPPMLGPGRYSQWRLRFLRYIDTKANVNAPAVPEHDEAETVHNMFEENKLYFKAETGAIFFLQLGEILNIQDVKTNLFWEFGSLLLEMENPWSRITHGSTVVQQNRIQCFNCKGFGHYAKECMKPKRVKDYSYHKENMMMCKQAEQGVQLQAEQVDLCYKTRMKRLLNRILEANISICAKFRMFLPEIHVSA